MSPDEGQAPRRGVPTTDQFEPYKSPANAMLTAATFAGSITVSAVLASRNSDLQTPGITELAYASSLFLGGVMGCVLIIVSISVKPSVPLWLIRIEVGVV